MSWRSQRNICSPQRKLWGKLRYWNQSPEGDISFVYDEIELVHYVARFASLVSIGTSTHSSRCGLLIYRPRCGLLQTSEAFQHGCTRLNFQRAFLLLVYCGYSSKRLQPRSPRRWRARRAGDESAKHGCERAQHRSSTTARPCRSHSPNVCLRVANLLRS